MYNSEMCDSVEIKKVIVNGPATVLLWSDGTKTVAKCSPDETFDPEKGVAMAIAFKILPKNQIKKAFKEAKEQRVLSNSWNALIDALNVFADVLRGAKI